MCCCSRVLNMLSYFSKITAVKFTQVPVCYQQVILTSIGNQLRLLKFYYFGVDLGH